MKYIMALDQGTTSSRTIIFDHQGRIVSVAQQEFAQYFPKPGWVEHDPEEIWSTQLATARQALADADLRADDIAALGITNQRETTICWDRDTGRPVGRAIVWQDRRTAAICDKLKNDRDKRQLIHNKTGLIPDAYFSATKIRWMLDHLPQAAELASKGRLAFGTVDSWLIYKLTAGAAHMTDVTNASRTMLFDIHRCQWDAELLELFELPESLVPEVRASSEIIAETDAGLLGRAIPIAGVAGDQHAALFGQACFHTGMAKCTVGTGCFTLLNTGPQPVRSQHQLLTTIAWKINGRVEYALEGSLFVAGAAIQWLRDGLGLIESAEEIEKLAATVSDNGGVYLVPAFTGLGAPHWDPYARGALVGITRGTNAGHLARAGLEGLAFQVTDVIDAMQEDADMAVSELRFDGGAARNELLMQILANFLQQPIVRPAILETTALGAAYLAGLAVGYWADTDELARQWQQDRSYAPRMNKDQIHTLRRQWQRALERSRSWVLPDEES